MNPSAKEQANRIIFHGIESVGRSVDILVTLQRERTVGLERDKNREEEKGTRSSQRSKTRDLSRKKSWK